MDENWKKEAVSPGETLKPAASEPSAPEAAHVRRLLLEAYDAGRRDLPWRGESDPYRIWVSEVMLQQTRVETVIPYYKEWVERFPDLEALASAREEEVLRAWQGLGYYSRARNLHGAAKLIRERLGGALPSSASELRTLPGVGEYTAGAVASIAFGEVVPAVDGNVSRVLSRLFDLPDPGLAQLRRTAALLVDPNRPGDFNQALMELGALVCTPRGPSCQACPLREVCLGRRRGTVEERPRRGRSPSIPESEVAVAVLVTPAPGGGRFFLRQRPPRGLLARMWEFPGWEVVPPRDPEEVLEASLGDEGGAGERQAVGSLDPVPHRFTHRKITYRPFLFLLTETVSLKGRWLSLQEIEDIPLPVAQEKILSRALKALGGQEIRVRRRERE